MHTYTHKYIHTYLQEGLGLTTGLLCPPKDLHTGKDCILHWVLPFWVYGRTFSCLMPT